VPITLIRVLFTEQAQKSRTQAVNSGESDRKQQMEKLCQRAGCHLTDIYRSLITNEVVFIIEGSLEQVTRIKSVLQRSGAYSSIEVDILHSVSELAQDRAAVRDLEAIWRPPDQDEIDRMLLDE